MAKIVIDVIPHEDQRYPTVGDWIEIADGLQIYVSKMSDPRYEELVLVHELVEAILCRRRGISQEAVDKFDLSFESNRPDGDLSEPGDDPTAPYRDEHRFATAVERLLAQELGVDWIAYETEVEHL